MHGDGRSIQDMSQFYGLTMQLYFQLLTTKYLTFRPIRLAKMSSPKRSSPRNIRRTSNAGSGIVILNPSIVEAECSSSEDEGDRVRSFPASRKNSNFSTTGSELQVPSPSFVMKLERLR